MGKVQQMLNENKSAGTFSVQNEHGTVIVCIDLAKAFDTVSH